MSGLSWYFYSFFPSRQNHPGPSLFYCLYLTYIPTNWHTDLRIHLNKIAPWHSHWLTEREIEWVTDRHKGHVSDTKKAAQSVCMQPNMSRPSPVRVGRTNIYVPLNCRWEEEHAWGKKQDQQTALRADSGRPVRSSGPLTLACCVCAEPERKVCLIPKPSSLCQTRNPTNLHHIAQEHTETQKIPIQLVIQSLPPSIPAECNHSLDQYGIPGS